MYLGLWDKTDCTVLGWEYSDGEFGIVRDYWFVKRLLLGVEQYNVSVFYSTDGVCIGSSVSCEYLLFEEKIAGRELHQARVVTSITY